jgi:hypothetical protein
LGALLHNSLGLPERSHEKNGVDRRIHAMQRLKTFFALDVFREEIDGHHVVAALAHLAEQRAAEIFRIARYAHQAMRCCVRKSSMSAGVVVIRASCAQYLVPSANRTIVE